MDKLMKMMTKKKDNKPMDENYKNAKMSMLHALRDEMSGMMKGDLDGAKLHKVEVAAPDKEGLSEGLEKAKDMLGNENGETEEMENSSEEPESGGELAQDVIEHEAAEGDLSDEEIDQLMMLLEKMKKSR